MDQVQPKIGVEYTENATIATLTDEQILDEGEVRALENSIMPLVEEAGAINLVIDFGNVKFLTSAALGLLIRVSKRIYESGGHLKLCGINPKILEIFKITRLDRIFDIYDDRPGAMQSFDQPTASEYPVKRLKKAATSAARSLWQVIRPTSL